MTIADVARRERLDAIRMSVLSSFGHIPPTGIPMKKTGLRLGAVVLALLVSLNLLAATKPTEVLKPYLDSHTCCVVEIDLTRTKPDDVSKWINTVLTGSKV